MTFQQYTQGLACATEGGGGNCIVLHKIVSIGIVNGISPTASHLLNRHGGKSDQHNKETWNVMRGEVHFPSLRTNPTIQRETNSQHREGGGSHVGEHGMLFLASLL